METTSTSAAHKWIDAPFTFEEFTANMEALTGAAVVRITDLPDFLHGEFRKFCHGRPQASPGVLSVRGSAFKAFNWALMQRGGLPFSIQFKPTPPPLSERVAQMQDAHAGIIEDLLIERVRQFDKFGPQVLSPLEWVGLLTEEVGEAAKEANEHHHNGKPLGDFKQELTQVGALVLQALQALELIEAQQLAGQHEPGHRPGYWLGIVEYNRALMRAADKMTHGCFNPPAAQPQ